jgi:hypothetical protein
MKENIVARVDNKLEQENLKYKNIFLQINKTNPSNYGKSLNKIFENQLENKEEGEGLLKYLLSKIIENYEENFENFSVLITLVIFNFTT